MFVRLCLLYVAFLIDKTLNFNKDSCMRVYYHGLYLTHSVSLFFQQGFLLGSSPLSPTSYIQIYNSRRACGHYRKMSLLRLSLFRQSHWYFLFSLFLSLILICSSVYILTRSPLPYNIPFYGLYVSGLSAITRGFSPSEHISLGSVPLSSRRCSAARVRGMFLRNGKTMPCCPRMYNSTGEQLPRFLPF